MELKDRFEKYEDYFLKDDGSNAMPRDLRAMMLLNHLAPSKNTIIIHSEHDEVFFSTDTECLNESASDADIKQLVMLGVRYYASHDCFSMFT